MFESERVREYYSRGVRPRENVVEKNIPGAYVREKTSWRRIFPGHMFGSERRGEEYSRGICPTVNVVEKNIPGAHSRE